MNDKPKYILQDYLDELDEKYRSEVPMNMYPTSSIKVRGVNDCNKKINKEYKDMPMEFFTPEIIKKIYEELVAKFGAIQIYMLSIFKECFELAVSEGVIESNPTSFVKIYSYRKSRTTVTNEICDKATPLFFSEPGGLLIGLACYLDASPRDIVGLRIKDIDLTNRSIIFPYLGSSRKPKEISIGDDTAMKLLKEAIKSHNLKKENPAYARNNKDENLFATKSGRRYGSAEILAARASICDALGVDDFNIASFKKHIRTLQL